MRKIERDEIRFALGGLDITLTHRVRHLGVLRSVHEDLADTERKQLTRRRIGVTIRDLAGHPGHERGDGALGADPLGRLAQVRDCRERDDGTPRVLGRVERELPSGGVAHEDDTLRVERVALDELIHETGRGRHIHGRAGPRPLDVASASILHVPGRDPGVAEGDAHVAGVDQVVRRLPGAAVDDDRERPQPVDTW